MMNPRTTEDTVTFLSGKRAHFHFQCKACGRCCSEYRIMLSPYDVIRLRKATGLSSGELIRRGTVRITRAPVKDVFGFAPVAAMFEMFGLSRIGVVPVAVMRFRDATSGGHACEFLSAEQGGKRLCAIYEDRPGMCRLHPLGCVTVNNRRRWFFRQPLCRTDDGVEWAVEDWIRISRLKPFLSANARYLRWIRQLLEEHETLALVSEHRWNMLGRILYDFDSVDMEAYPLPLKGIDSAGAGNISGDRGSVPMIDAMFQCWLSQAKSECGSGGRDARRRDG